jgi:hypothetical protein
MTTEPEEARIRQFNDYLRDHLGEDYRVAQLEHRFNLSRDFVSTRVAVVRRLGEQAFSREVMVSPHRRYTPWVPPPFEVTDHDGENRLRRYLAATPRDERMSVRRLATAYDLTPVYVRDIVRDERSAN